MTKLEERHKVLQDEAQAKYDWLEKKYIEQDKALVKYKKEVGELKSQVAVAEAEAFRNDSTLEQQKREIQDLEAQVYDQKKELKNLDKAWSELLNSKKSESLLRQKLDTAERNLHDNDLQIRELEDEKRELTRKVQRTVEDIDQALSRNNNLDH